MRVTRKTKVMRDAVADIDYADKLSDSDSQWLDLFMRATAGQDVDAMAILTNQDPIKLGRLQHKIYDEVNAQRRDITYVGTRVDVEDNMDGDETARLMDEVNFGKPVCRRCLKRRCLCGPRFQVEVKQYDQRDYTQAEYSEDARISELELTKRMEAFDLLPYGDSPKDLEQGHAVKVCLPHHLLDKALGYVLTFRPVSGEYLVRSMSKSGLKNKDGSRPRATLLYVKPDGLKRSRPEIVKAFSTSSDLGSRGKK